MIERFAYEAVVYKLDGKPRVDLQADKRASIWKLMTEEEARLFGACELSELAETLRYALEDGDWDGVREAIRMIDTDPVRKPKAAAGAEESGA